MYIICLNRKEKITQLGNGLTADLLLHYIQFITL